MTSVSYNLLCNIFDPILIITMLIDYSKRKICYVKSGSHDAWLGELPVKCSGLVNYTRRGNAFARLVAI